MAVKLRSVSRQTADCWLLIDSWLALKSDNTIRQYKSALNAWCRFLVAETYSPEGAEVLLSADDRDAYEYLANFRARPAQPGRSAAVSKTISKATIAKTVTILATIYRELERSRFIERNPFTASFRDYGKTRKADRRPAQLMPYEAVSKILERPDRSDEGRRDAAFLALLFGGGLRIGEAVSLTLADITFSETSAIAHLRCTKSGETASQVIAFGSDRIREYYDLRVTYDDKLQPFLVSYAYGKPKGTWSISTAHRTFKRYCRACGLPSFSPHCARATAITKLLDDGIPHRDVATFSRHSSVQMVERYDKRRLKISDAIAQKLKF